MPHHTESLRSPQISRPNPLETPEGRRAFQNAEVQLIPVQEAPAVASQAPDRRFTAPSPYGDNATQVIETRRSGPNVSLDKPLTGNFADMLGQVQEKQRVRDKTKNKRGLGRAIKWLR